MGAALVLRSIEIIVVVIVVVVVVVAVVFDDAVVAAVAPIWWQHQCTGKLFKKFQLSYLLLLLDVSFEQHCCGGQFKYLFLL